MILDAICENKRREIARARARVSIEELRARARRAPDPRGFAGALEGGPPARMIAEVKKASPSRGLLRPGLQPVPCARAYRAAGAAAISVVTDRAFFRGDPAWIPAVREAAGRPVLMKDFFLDPWQAHLARSLGADAILLIVRILPPGDLRALLRLARDLGMEPLVECHAEDEIRAAARAGARVFGVNSRDLDTLKVDLGRALRMGRRLPRNAVRVAESGIRTRADVLAVEAAGFDAFLVGETLMRSPDLAAAAGRLLGRGPAPHRGRREAVSGSAA